MNLRLITPLITTQAIIDNPPRKAFGLGSRILAHTFGICSVPMNRAPPYYGLVRSLSAPRKAQTILSADQSTTARHLLSSTNVCIVLTSSLAYLLDLNCFIISSAY